MLGKIIAINESIVSVKLDVNIYDYDGLIGKNVIFKDTDFMNIGEVIAIGNGIMQVALIGEVRNDKFLFGDITKPSFKAGCYLIDDNTLNIILNNDAPNTIKLGKSYIYPDYDIKLDVGNFFSNHFAILGNSGSGKSYSVAKILQSVFYQCKSLPFYSNIFLFDAYGEYQRAFSRIREVNENINYKVYTTDLNSTEFEIINYPFWLLGIDDLCLLLGVTSKEQIPIIEKALKLVSYFSRKEEEVINQKNDIIARCLLDVLFSGKSPSMIRNKIVSILTKFNTANLNLEIKLEKGGWTRTIRQCLFVEQGGEFADVELVIEYLESLCLNNFELSLPNGEYMYSMKDFSIALEFALISEGALNSDTTFELANVLKVRFNNLMNSDYARYFDYTNGYVNREGYINLLLTCPNGRKAQIVNFNINYVDDRFAKNLVKIYSKLLFDYIVSLNQRASMPFHIVLEEAHRYVQNDGDVNILGYNIFERITKEGRKYGLLLGIVSQRPSELSETTISQCNNFLVFKMFHPKDLQFIKDIISSADITVTNKIKTLHPGTCIMFGTAFKMPTIAILDKPNPEPLSQSCDINKTWYIHN
ncbi:MAG: ATP-binding protein [Bacilli bacterium]